MKREAIILLTFCAQLACAGGSEVPTQTLQAQQATGMHDGGAAEVRDGAADASADPGASAARKAGEFSLQLVAPVPALPGSVATPGFTTLLGKVYRGPLPDALVWEKRAEGGGCTLLTPRVPFCEEGCGSAICVEDDVCEPNPATVNLGTLTVSGVRTESGATSFAVDPIRNNYITPGAVRMPFPAFAEGDTVTLTTTGGELAPLTLAGVGIAPLALHGADEGYALTRDEPLELAWDPPAEPGASRIQVKLDISHHGGTKGKIECDVEDDGALSIPASLVGGLMDLGIAGFPTVMVTRSSLASTTTSVGRVDLRIYSYVEGPIVIPGLVSCTEDADCATGQRCRNDRSCG